MDTKLNSIKGRIKGLIEVGDTKRWNKFSKGVRDKEAGMKAYTNSKPGHSPLDSPRAKNAAAKNTRAGEGAGASFKAAGRQDRKDRGRWEAMNKAKGVDRPYKPTLEQSRKSFKQRIQKLMKEGIADKLGKTTPDSLKQAGGDPSVHAKIKKSKDAEFAQNTAPTHYQKKDDGTDTLRRDRKAGPKGNSAHNTFEKKGHAVKDGHKFASGTKTAPMSVNKINQKGVGGKTVHKDGQNIPSERWSALKGALANRKFNKSMSKIPDVN